MSQPNPLSAASLGYIKTASAALEEMANAHTALAAREIRLQALMAELAASLERSSANTLTLLRVQTAMQREAQIFASVSNVMKTKHDTVKNSISNIR